jgi:spore coat protein U-like protein
MKLLLHVITVGVVLTTVAISTARGELRLEMDNIEWKERGGAGYSVFSPEEQIQTVRFRVRSTEATPFFVTFGGAADGDGKHKAASQRDELEFIVCDSVVRRNALKELGFANANEVIRGTFAVRETEKELSCVIVVPAGQIRPAGRYTDALRVNLYKGTPDKHVLSDSKSVVVSIPVEPVTELSLAQSGAAFDAKAALHKLDFGRLTRSKSLGLDLRVRSNSGYSITIESENGGRLKNLDERDTSTLPYELRIGGKQTDVQGAQVKLMKSARQLDASGDRHDLQFSIGDLRGVTAGTYRDTITITVSSEQ